MDCNFWVPILNVIVRHDPPTSYHQISGGKDQRLKLAILCESQNLIQASCFLPDSKRKSLGLEAP